MSQRKVLVEAVQRIVNILQKETQDVSGSIYISSQQPLGDLVQPLWHYRRGKFIKLRQLALIFAAGGPLEQLAETNGWFSQFKESQASFDAAFQALNCVRYFDSEVPVQLGDHVSLRVLFRRRAGRVCYLPGVSPENPEIDFGGLCRIGIDFTGGFMMWQVDPDSLELKKGVTLVNRDPVSVPAVPTAEDLNA